MDGWMEEKAVKGVWDGSGSSHDECHRDGTWDVIEIEKNRTYVHQTKTRCNFSVFSFPSPAHTYGAGSTPGVDEEFPLEFVGLKPMRSS